MVLAFDLDDTLYEELNYVKSGFREVARWLLNELGIDENSSYQFMVNELERSGRGNIFNNLLAEHELFSKSRLKKCISVYRLHFPDIRLSKEASECLLRLKSHSKYVVTDGNKLVQYNKVKALELDKMQAIRKIFITYRHGLKHGKPSPYCFMKICELENTTPEHVVYIGDNPHKDFVGIKPFGFKTIRVLQGNFKNLQLDEAHEADLRIHSLEELTDELIESLEQKAVRN
jgi:putative hydrolase of the HAD superfamily